MTILADPKFMAYVELGSPLDRDVEFGERFTGPRGVWTAVRVEYGGGQGSR